MNPEPAIARMKERDLDIETERQNETKRKTVTCPAKLSETQYIEKDIL